MHLNILAKLMINLVKVIFLKAVDLLKIQNGEWHNQKILKKIRKFMIVKIVSIKMTKNMNNKEKAVKA